jgi:hypothetical protein
MNYNLEYQHQWHVMPATKQQKSNMNYQEMKQVVELLDSLPGFDNYAYFHEGIREVKRDEDGKIIEIVFPCGYLKRTVANKYANSQTAWVLGYNENILGVFLVA